MSAESRTPIKGRAAATLNGALILVGACFTILFASIAVLRLCYPFEVEWMEGAVLDHAVRVFEGLPIYTAPSIDFAAWLYPPGYYYATAAVMWFTGEGFLAGRIVSVVSCLIVAALCFGFVKKEGGLKLYAALAPALWFGMNASTGYYFDIVRVDVFFTALIVLGAYSAAYFKARLGLVLTALIFTLAFFTKQQAIFFHAAIALWFFWQSRRRGLEFLAVSAVMLTSGLLYAQVVTHGWFAYFVFAIPGAKRADFSVLRAFDVFPKYVLGPWGIGAAIIACASIVLYRLGSWRRDSVTSLLMLMLISALISGALSIGNDGGYKNVMMPYAAFLVPLILISLSQLSTHWAEARTIGALILLLQFIALIYDPTREKMVLASAHQQHGAEQFISDLRAMPGEVFIPYHGYITRQAGKKSHAHILASIDVLRMHDTTAARFSREFDSAYAQHKFSAVIMEESKAFRVDSLNGYQLSRVMLAEPNVGLTRVADDATRPQFVFIPRQ